MQQHVDFAHLSTAVLVSTMLSLFSVWVRPVVQRHLKQIDEENYIIHELQDIRRHIKANIVILREIERAGCFPALMHLIKLKIPDSSAVFSIETLKLSRFTNASRLYQIALKLRNLNVEIDDLINYCNEDYLLSDFINLVKYHLEKSERVCAALSKEIPIITIGFGMPQDSVVIPEIVRLPQRISDNSLSNKDVPSKLLKGKFVQSDEGDNQSPQSGTLAQTMSDDQRGDGADNSPMP